MCHSERVEVNVRRRLWEREDRAAYLELPADSPARQVVYSLQSGSGSCVWVVTRDSRAKVEEGGATPRATRRFVESVLLLGYTLWVYY